VAAAGRRSSIVVVMSLAPRALCRACAPRAPVDPVEEGRFYARRVRGQPTRPVRQRRRPSPPAGASDGAVCTVCMRQVERSGSRRPRERTGARVHPPVLPLHIRSSQADKQGCTVRWSAAKHAQAGRGGSARGGHRTARRDRHCAAVSGPRLLGRPRDGPQSGPRGALPGGVRGALSGLVRCVGARAHRRRRAGRTGWTGLVRRRGHAPVRVAPARVSRYAILRYAWEGSRRRNLPSPLAPTYVPSSMIVLPRERTTLASPVTSRPS